MAAVTLELKDGQKLGCGFDVTAEAAKVSKVQPGSIAEQHKVGPGFVLISINGESCNGMAEAAIKQKLKERPLTLTLRPSTEDVPSKEMQRRDPAAPDEFTREVKEGGLGFSVSQMPPAPKILVKKVEQDGWAAKEGIFEGYELLKVQDEPTSAMSQDTFRKLMKNQRPLSLTFRRVTELSASTAASEVAAPSPSTKLDKAEDKAAKVEQNSAQHPEATKKEEASNAKPATQSAEVKDAENTRKQSSRGFNEEAQETKSVKDPKASPSEAPNPKDRAAEPAKDERAKDTSPNADPKATPPKVHDPKDDAKESIKEEATTSLIPKRGSKTNPSEARNHAQNAKEPAQGKRAQEATPNTNPKADPTDALDSKDRAKGLAKEEGAKDLPAKRDPKARALEASDVKHGVNAPVREESAKDLTPSRDPSANPSEVPDAKGQAREPSREEGAKDLTAKRNETASVSSGAHHHKDAAKEEPAKDKRPKDFPRNSDAKDQTQILPQLPKDSATSDLVLDQVRLREALATFEADLQTARRELAESIGRSQDLALLKEQLSQSSKEASKAKELLAHTMAEASQAKEELSRATGEAAEAKEALQQTISEARMQAPLPASSAPGGEELKDSFEKPGEVPVTADSDLGRRIRELPEVRELKQQVEWEMQLLRSDLTALTAEVAALRSTSSPLSTPDFMAFSGEAPMLRNDGAPELFRDAQPLLRPTSSAKQRKEALEAVEGALRSGISPNSWQGPGTPLKAAVQAKSSALVGALLRAHGDPGEIDAQGVSLLHLATFHNEVEVSKLLLEANANPNVTDRFAQTPLFFAPTRVMCMMLHRYEADVNLTNSRGQSALHLAAKAGLSDVLHWLSAKASPSLRQARDSAGLRAADVAKAQGLTPPLLAKLETGAGAGASSRAAVPETKRSGLKTR